MSKYLTFLFLSLTALSCGKVAYKNRIESGTYPCTVYFLHTWSPGQAGHGTIRDTTYTSFFNIEESPHDVARIQFFAYDGVLIKDQLDFTGFDADTMLFTTPSGPDNQRSELRFSDSTGRLQYTNYLRDNAASGGNKIVYTIRNY